MNELSQLENRIKDKIAQTKHKIYMTQERTVTDGLWPEIETLNWVINEILVLNRNIDDVDQNMSGRTRSMGCERQYSRLAAGIIGKDSKIFYLQ